MDVCHMDKFKLRDKILIIVAPFSMFSSLSVAGGRQPLKAIEALVMTWSLKSSQPIKGVQVVG